MKKVLKVLAIFFCFCLMAGAVLSVQAEESSTQSAIALESAENGRVTISLSTKEAMTGLSGKLVYDETKLSYVGVSFNGAVKENNTDKDSILNEGGNLQFVLVGDVKNGTAGEWMTVTFQVKKAGKTEIKLQDVLGADEKAAAKSLSSNSVKVDARLSGKSATGNDPDTGVKKITTVVVILAAVSAVVLVLLFCLKKKPAPDEAGAESPEAENPQSEEGKEE